MWTISSSSHRRPRTCARLWQQWRAGAGRAAMRAAEEALKTVRDQGTQQGLLDRMQSRAELYDLLGYKEWEERDPGYFTPDSK